jgi:hypothetical protein
VIMAVIVKVLENVGDTQLPYIPSLLDISALALLVDLRIPTQDVGSRSQGPSFDIPLSTRVSNSFSS